jgi:hypothetical protein
MLGLVEALVEQGAEVTAVARPGRPRHPVNQRLGVK